MRMTMAARREVLRVTAGRYQRARKREKSKILDEFIETTGYSRWHASRLLRNFGRSVRFNEKTILRGSLTGRKGRSGRRRYYDDKTVRVLTKVWRLMDYICGKRLRPVLPEIVERLERFGEIRCDAEVRKKLSEISAATIDRVLRSERKKYELKGRSHTKPGTLLKHQIPIRTFSEWDEDRPGFGELDLVGHDGGVAAGDFCQTLDLTDIATTWTETEAVRNKAAVHVFAAIQEVKIRLPFDLLGIDSDNGSEFINTNLENYCRTEEITFTRSRPYRKNDNCYVEQKNWSVVRRAVGYARFDTDEQLDLLNELYRHLRLYTNYFMPSMKLIERTRIGSQVRKKYDSAQTPYRRVLASPHISDEVKQNLRTQYEILNPAELKRRIGRLQSKLDKSVSTLKRSPAKERRLSSLVAAREAGAWVT